MVALHQFAAAGFRAGGLFARRIAPRPKAVLPAALAKRVGVLINLPFGGRRDGNLFSRVAGRPLPDWAAEIGAKTWGQIFLKYVVSHPAVTVAIPGMTQASRISRTTWMRRAVACRMRPCARAWKSTGTRTSTPERKGDRSTRSVPFRLRYLPTAYSSPPVTDVDHVRLAVRLRGVPEAAVEHAAAAELVVPDQRVRIHVRLTVTDGRRIHRDQHVHQRVEVLVVVPLVVARDGPG